MNGQETKNKILDLVQKYYQEKFLPNQQAPKKRIPFSERVFDEKELVNLVESSLDFWLTAGRFSMNFEYKFAKFMDVEHCLLVNSGSSANLVAFTTLTSPKLGEKRLKKGEEVITVAAGFPTTVNPIVQNGLIPVFVDVDLETYNIDNTQLENALSNKTRAIMIAHTLGNPFNLDAVMAFAKEHDLYVVEDCCDAVGSTYNGQKVGTFGHLATVSFYPAHHMTMGEGGAVLTNDDELMMIATSIRDWGRDCYCAPGADNTCGRRFSMQFEKLPYGYDHKYVYSHVGYNLKVTDMQAAIGVAQLDKLQGFIDKRKENFIKIKKALSLFEKWLSFATPTENSDPSWFGFPITLKKNVGFIREDLTQHIESEYITTRLLFAGNLTKQPAYDYVEFRSVGNLENTDYIMENTFFIGVYPGINDEDILKIQSTFSSFFERL